MKMSNSETTPITVQAPSSTIDVYREVMTGIQTGSYAVLLAIAVVYVLTRKSIGRAWHKHFDLLETLKDVQESNAKSLRIIATSNKRIADLMSDPRLSSTQEAVDSIKMELTKAQMTLESTLGKDDDEQ
jgi:hypothetical protein